MAKASDYVRGCKSEAAYLIRRVKVRARDVDGVEAEWKRCTANRTRATGITRTIAHVTVDLTLNKLPR